MQKLLSPWYINLQLGFNFEMFLHFMHSLSLDLFSWFAYLASLLHSGDFPHMFPDPWWPFLFNSKALKFWLEALWSLVLSVSNSHSCEIGLNDGQSLRPQISMQGGQSLESFNFSRKKFSTLLHAACPLVSNHLYKVAQVLGSVCHVYSGLVITLIFNYVPHPYSTMCLIFQWFYLYYSILSMTKPLYLSLSVPGDKVPDHLYSVCGSGRGKLKVLNIDCQPIFCVPPSPLRITVLFSVIFCLPLYQMLPNPVLCWVSEGAGGGN